MTFSSQNFLYKKANEGKQIENFEVNDLFGGIQKAFKSWKCKEENFFMIASFVEKQFMILKSNISWYKMKSIICRFKNEFSDSFYEVFLSRILLSAFIVLF